jgi:hypothetical protein
MLVSLRHRLVIFAMPKCASTALEHALAADMDLVIQGHPGAKHTNYRKYDRHLRRYLESFTKEPLETVCLFREPTDWLGSWWRYRGRAGIPNPAKSTAGMSFDAFVTAHLDGAKGPAEVGRQSRFVSDKDGNVGIDRIFRYEDQAAWHAYLSDRLGRDIALERANVSPDRTGMVLSAATDARLQTEMARDFEIYAALP